MWYFQKKVWLCFKPWLNYYPFKNSFHFFRVLPNKNIQLWRTSMIQRTLWKPPTPCGRSSVSLVMSQHLDILDWTGFYNSPPCKLSIDKNGSTTICKFWPYDDICSCIVACQRIHFQVLKQIPTPDHFLSPVSTACLLSNPNPLVSFIYIDKIKNNSTAGNWTNDPYIWSATPCQWAMGFCIIPLEKTRW